MKKKCWSCIVKLKIALILVRVFGFKDIEEEIEKTLKLQI
jgi:hypothetical protein